MKRTATASRLDTIVKDLQKTLKSSKSSAKESKKRTATKARLDEILQDLQEDVKTRKSSAKRPKTYEIELETFKDNCGFRSQKQLESMC